jgi:hypothetical protein
MDIESSCPPVKTRHVQASFCLTAAKKLEVVQIAGAQNGFSRKQIEPDWIVRLSGWRDTKSARDLCQIFLL